MGLDAVVYRNKKNLKLGSDERVGETIPETGEVYFENEEVSRKYRNQRHSAKHRLGNITGISALRNEVAQLNGPESVILQRVLYSGTHSGDTIPLEALASLSAEVNSINNARHRSPELRSFVNALEELIQAAKDEGNPIVFV